VEDTNVTQLDAGLAQTIPAYKQDPFQLPLTAYDVILLNQP